MANLPGTNVSAPVRPFSADDSFPTAHANELLGGHHNKLTLTARDAILPERRERGMTCFVEETGKLYKLTGGILNTHWVDFTAALESSIASANTTAGTAATTAGTALSTANTANTTANGAASGLAAQVVKQAADLLSRDTMYGINLRRTHNLSADMAALKPPQTFISPIPWASGATTASQSGNTVTASGSVSVFRNDHIGKRIIFANGQSCVITAVPGVTVDDSVPQLTATVDRAQTVTPQIFRIQASGVCFVVEGDSIAETNKVGLRCKLYHSLGYGGTFISPSSDTTQAKTEAFVVSAGVTTPTTAFDCAPAGRAWLVPAGETVEGWINAKYKDGESDWNTLFDVPQVRRRTDTCTVVWKRKAGATLRIEARLHENSSQTDGWILLADNVDAGAGTEYLAWTDLPHAMGVCWHYRVTVLTDSGGGGLTVVGIYTENRLEPGMAWVSWNTGGMKMSDSMTIQPSALKVLNWIFRVSARFYEYRDYSFVNGVAAGQVPDLPARIGVWRQQWVDAGVRCTHIFVGGYPNQLGTAYQESGVYRDLCLQTFDPFVDAMAVFRTYTESMDAGTMVNGDTVHGNSWIDPLVGGAIAILLGLFESPFTTSPNDVDALSVRATRLYAGDEDVALAIEAAKAGPWANGVFNRSTSGFAAWASSLPAPGTAGFTVQMWVELPSANPSATLSLFGIHNSESTSNAAGIVTCVVDIAGRFSITFRNAANSGTATYRLGGSAKTPGDFIREYGGRRGCLTVIVDPTKPHPQVYFNTERVNDKALMSYAASTTVERITDPINIPGTSFTLGITATHFARQVAYWAGGTLPTWEGELKRNAQRGFVGGLGASTPTAYWVASTGSGRYIRDISGNGRHIKLGGSSPTGVSGRNNPGDGLTTGYAWLDPKGVRTTFVMTTNAGMVPMYGEDVYVDMATAPVITLPAIANPDGAEIRIWNKGTSLPTIAQQGAATQIVTGAGTTDGVDRTTAGTTGSVLFGQRYSMMALRPLTADVWTTPAFPAGATVSVSSGVNTTPEAASITGARIAAMLDGGIQTSGTPYSAWAVVPALGTAGFTMAWTGLVPAAIPGANLYLARTSSNRATSNVGGALDVVFNTSGRLAINVRSVDNLSSRSWGLSNFITAHAGRNVRITVRFNPAATEPEVWVENAKVSSSLVWAIQDTGTTPPTMATADLTGTNLMAGCDSPCYQFALWSGVLADAQVAENQRNGAVVGATAPLVYYTFREGEGRISADLSGNGRNVQFLNSSGSTGNDAGNGITTGVRWLRKHRRSSFQATANLGLVLRPGERTITNHATVRVACAVDPVVEMDREDIVLENVGAAGFLLTLPTGHKAVMGAGATPGTDATSLGGTLTSTQLYSVVVLRPLIVNSATDVVWRIVSAVGVTLA